MTITRPAYIDAVLRRGLLRLHQVQQADRQGPGAVGASSCRVMEMMYSFQKDRKLKRMMVTMEGWAMGKMMLTMVRAVAGAVDVGGLLVVVGAGWQSSRTAGRW